MRTLGWCLVLLGVLGPSCFKAGPPADARALRARHPVDPGSRRPGSATVGRGHGGCLPDLRRYAVGSPPAARSPPIEPPVLPCRARGLADPGPRPVLASLSRFRRGRTSKRRWASCARMLGWKSGPADAGLHHTSKRPLRRTTAWPRGHALPETHRWAAGRGVGVAVIDTAVDMAHPDLQGRIQIGRDFVGRGAAPLRDAENTAPPSPASSPRRATRSAPLAWPPMRGFWRYGVAGRSPEKGAAVR